MLHRPLTDRDMALITVLCQDRETRCEQRVTAAVKAGDKVKEKIAIADRERYQSLRLKMFFPS
jgi:hypothetical protein